MKTALPYIISCTAAVLLFNCAHDALTGGTGEETTNGRVYGTIVEPTRRPIANAVVKLLPADYNPVMNTAAVRIDTTDDEGRYDFSRLDSGEFNLLTASGDSAKSAIRPGIAVNQDTVEVSPVTLLPSGAVKIMLPADVNPEAGYIYLPGTDIYTDLLGRTDFVVMASVPSGDIPSIVYSTVDGTSETVIRYDFRVASEDTTRVFNPSWLYSRMLRLNTTQRGAYVAERVVDFPLLIRLNADNFDFSQAQAGGEDIRFTKSDNTPLNHEIERWDPAAELAEVWVKVDTVHGNDSSQSVAMYWGNNAVNDGSNSAAVFDTSDGFRGVWHLAEAGNTTARDATINRYDGTPTGMSAASAVEGSIGGAQEFDGVTSCFTMANTAGGALNFTEFGPYTISAWVFINTLDTALHTVVSKGNRQYNLGAMASEWGFSVCPAGGGWDVTNSAAASKAWTHLVGVRNGTLQYLFVNGICVDSTVSNRYPSSTRYTGDDLHIGKNPNGSTYFFKGTIDEVCISGVARDPAWIKLSYLNQKADDKLVGFRKSGANEKIIAGIR